MVCVRKSETSTHNAPREPLKGETLGRAQRVGMCREPGDLPYMALRRPCEGKGRQPVWADPDCSRLGFVMRAASLAVWDYIPSLCVGERGKQAVLPPAALPPSAGPGEWYCDPGQTV